MSSSTETPTAGRGTAIFRVENLKKEYRMGEVTVSALRNVSIDIFEGEFLVILGHSGSGKSTLLNIIGGIDTPTGGNVFFANDNLAHYGESQLTAYRRNHIGFVFQFYNLIPNLTAEENVEMATEISPDPLPAKDMLALVGLLERRDHFPAQLSGGEQQRVALARALAKHPKILLCDEPTGALDFSTGKVVLQALDDINRKTGTTVVIITHNAVIAEMGHRVIRLADGLVREVIENAVRKTADDLEW